jgi:ABC-type molybdate transport system permease subunit
LNLQSTREYPASIKQLDSPLCDNSRPYQPVRDTLKARVALLLTLGFALLLAMALLTRSNGLSILEKPVIAAFALLLLIPPFLLGALAVWLFRRK